jgi:hypothetical protein
MQQAQQQEQAAAAQAEQMKMQIEQQNSALKAQEMQQKAEIEQVKTQLDGKVQQASLTLKEQEIALKARDMALKEFEAQKPEPDPNIKLQADMQMAREKMEFDAREADKQRRVDLVKAIMSEFNSSEGGFVSPEDAGARASEIMGRINEVVSATRQVGGVPLEESAIMVMDGEEDFVDPVLQ